MKNASTSAGTEAARTGLPITRNDYLPGLAGRIHFPGSKRKRHADDVSYLFIFSARGAPKKEINSRAMRGPASSGR